MHEPVTLILIEENPHDRESIKRSLEEGFDSVSINEINSLVEFEGCLEGAPPDIIIADYHIGWNNGIEVIKSLKQTWPHCPVIMFTTVESEENAVEAMKAGLGDYLLNSPPQFTRLPEIVKNLLDKKEKETAPVKTEELFQNLFNHQ